MQPIHQNIQSKSPKTGQVTIPNILTIAGSDSGGGAGIQADIKAISATKSYACSVVTALTAQNTKGVSSIYSVTPDFISSQIDTIMEDIRIDAVKIGMLGNKNIVDVVANKVVTHSLDLMVLDPVMVATSGDRLIDEDAVELLKHKLIPLASLVTPNIYEAALLVGAPVPRSIDDIHGLIELIQQDPLLNNQPILLKGGHLETDLSQDFLIQGDHVDVFASKRLDTKNTHGTGCTLSSAIASYLGQGLSLYQSVELGKKYLFHALEHADQLDVGLGCGPVHHFYQLS